MKKYGHIIADLRKQKGLTQEQLGKQLNVSYQAVSKWENNLSQPDLQTLEKLCDILGVTISQFFELANENKQPINIIQEDKSKPKIKPRHIVMGLGLAIIISIIFAVCSFLVPVKLSSNQVLIKYNLSVFYISASNPHSPKSGTGFFINNTGLAVTVYSNITDCKQATVLLNNGEEYEVEKIVGFDEENNIAIIQVDIPKSIPVKIGNSNNVKMGNNVYAITYLNNDTLQEAQSKIAEGMIYKVESNSDGTMVIQTNATISDSNKGGVLIDTAGNAIGIINGDLNISGNVAFDMVNVCIPINKVNKVEHNLNISLVEHYNNHLTVNYMLNNQVVKTKEVYKNELLESEDYSKTGYNFIGYYKDENFNEIFNFFQPIQQSCNIYIKLEPIKYYIRFNGDGCIGEMQMQEFVYDQPQKLNECLFTKEYLMLKNWKYGEKIFYDKDTIVNLTATHNQVIDFYAQWKELEYTITFDANGANGGMNNIVYKCSQTYTLPNNAFYKTGYTFSHWECEGKEYLNKQQIDLLSKTQSKFVFKAIWTPISYSINYCYGDFNYNAGVANYDEEFTLIDCYYHNQIVDYFTFNSQKYYVGDVVKNLTTYSTTINLNIVFRGVNFDIKYILSDTKSETYSYIWGNNVHLKDCTSFAKTGYYFNSYTSNKNNKNYSAGDLFADTSFEVRQNEILEFIVNWKPIAYNVLIDNYSLSNETLSLTYDTPYTLPQNLDYKQGYTFVNYSLYINNEIVRYVADKETLINLTTSSKANIKLIPNWEANDITINYYVDEQLYATYLTKYDSTHATPSCNIQKDGLWFNGWLYNDIYVIPNTYITIKDLQSERNCYAIWSKVLQGEGTQIDPYLIQSYDDLCSITYLCGNANFHNKYFKLTEDIDCENKEIKAISNFNKGYFDGNNKVIKNAKLIRSTGDNIGLFGYVCDSTIINLGLENFVIDYSGYDAKTFGGLCAFAWNSTIENCWSVGKINANAYITDPYESFTIGGFLGVANSNCVIKNCFAQTEITASHTNPDSINTAYNEKNIAGLIGISYGLTIYNCYSICSINSSHTNKPFISVQNNITINNCFYGYYNGELKIINNVDANLQLQYYIIKDSNILTTTFEQVYDLNYLNIELQFDLNIWQSNISLPLTLKSFKGSDETNY
ncbi:MAG: helix-turn-helix domain-containing protein [Clostridiales bacterium]|nr:helix-turn-helix domain-containing protein [Clostridiales bacterium]